MVRPFFSLRVSVETDLSSCYLIVPQNPKPAPVAPKTGKNIPMVFMKEIFL